MCIQNCYRRYLQTDTTQLCKRQDHTATRGIRQALSKMAAIKTKFAVNFKRMAKRKQALELAFDLQSSKIRC